MDDIIKSISTHIKELLDKKFSGEITFTIRFVNGGIKFSRVKIEQNL